MFSYRHLQLALGIRGIIFGGIATLRDSSPGWPTLFFVGPIAGGLLND
jgi:hypothetical protein